MFFDLTKNYIKFTDVVVNAAELTLVFGLLLLLLDLSFCLYHYNKIDVKCKKNDNEITIKYPILVEYSSRVSVFILFLVQLFNLKSLIFLLSFQNASLFFTFHGALIINNEILILKTIIITLAIFILLVSETYFKETKLGYFEYNILFLSSVFGCLVTLSANDLMVFYISLEIQALAFYIMSSMKKSANSSEAGLKYFIIGSFSSALLLFGVSLILLITGHHNFENIALHLAISLSKAYTLAPQNEPFF